MLCTGHSRRRNLSFIAISLAWRRAAPALHGATLITLSADGSSDYRRQGSGRRRYRLRRTHVVGASGKLIMAPIVARSVLPSASILRVASSTYGVPMEFAISRIWIDRVVWHCRLVVSPGPRRLLLCMLLCHFNRRAATPGVVRPCVQRTLPKPAFAWQRFSN